MFILTTISLPVSNTLTHYADLHEEVLGVPASLAAVGVSELHHPTVPPLHRPAAIITPPARTPDVATLVEPTQQSDSFLCKQSATRRVRVVWWFQMPATLHDNHTSPTALCCR